ncbi:hypothetical protein K3G63_15930 [Hymenobacter sp. HSC-4F20]|uniref:hypothetical protein n=1 Tax=Hymenobacter sp. HSC-4F20 TaxID=2864135 RepID=UPI001C7377BD|nr:hypothetical protein [Hymenobacter sp. HSC-4F20]MBX0291943.1 hypothetical protein [Hymenobacter sp. HSC-4F20]
MQQALKKRLSASVNDIDNGNFLLSFQHLDREQGQSFEHWQMSQKLSEAMHTLWNYCLRPLREQLDGDKFTEYGNFPPSDKTSFYHPRQVPPDANWARIHVDGVHCLIGHIVRNVFYVVFFDENHEFWHSTLKNT